jgi:hypothetical protein
VFAYFSFCSAYVTICIASIVINVLTSGRFMSFTLVLTSILYTFCIEALATFCANAFASVRRHVPFTLVLTSILYTFCIKALAAFWTNAFTFVRFGCRCCCNSGNFNG